MQRRIAVSISGFDVLAVFFWKTCNPVAGKQVYAATCVACHGDNGQGVRRGKAGDANGYLFPPLWDSDSYNNGAGMARVTLGAGFIKG